MTTNAQSLPDSARLYSPDLGCEITAGDVRGGQTESEPKGLDTEDDVTIRMWLAIALYDPKASPWRSGRIRVGSKEYPASVCTSDQFLPLYTSSGMFADADINARSRPDWKDIPSPTRGSP